MADWKLTDYMDFYPDAEKFRVAKSPESAKAVFLCIGPGGKGSEYISMTPTEALALAEYLLIEGNRANRAIQSKATKAK